MTNDSSNRVRGCVLGAALIVMLWHPFLAGGLYRLAAWIVPTLQAAIYAVPVAAALAVAWLLYAPHRMR